MASCWNTPKQLATSLLLLYFSGIECSITSPPRNTATKVGGQTHLNCSGNNGFPGWTFGEGVNPPAVVGLSSSCSVSSTFSSRYRSEAQGSNTCNLIISNPTSQEAGLYSCLDGDLSNNYAVLTVLGSSGTPTVSRGSDVTEGDQLTMTCTVAYYTASDTINSSPIAPNIYWTTSGINITNAVSQKTNVSVTSSITVVATRSGVPPYNCTAYFLPPPLRLSVASNAPTNVYIGATDPITDVYYGPTTPNITRRIVSVTENGAIVCAFNELTCSSSANPSPSYTWTDVTTRNVVATGNVLRLAEDSSIYRCAVLNRVNSSSTTYNTDISQPRQCNPAKRDNIKIYSVDAHCDNATNSCSCVNGSHVTLICEVTNAFPLPVITWVDTNGNTLSRTSSVKATTNGSYICRSSNQINILINTNAEKSLSVTDCSNKATTTPSNTIRTNLTPPRIEVIAPAVLVPIWVILNIILTSVFLIYYNGTDPIGKHEHKKILNNSFPWLKPMLPCFNESSDGGCSRCLWVFLFVLMSITVGFIVFTILLIRVNCKCCANCRCCAKDAKTSSTSTSTSKEIKLEFSHISDGGDEGAAISHEGQGTTRDHSQPSSEARRDPVPYEECSITTSPRSETHRKVTKATKTKEKSTIPNYAKVNKTNQRTDDQESDPYSVIDNPDDIDVSHKTFVPLPPIKPPHQTSAQNPNAPFYGELNFALQSNSRKPVQFMTVESDTQYAPLKKT